MLRYALFLLAGLLCVVETRAANVLLVISGSSPSTEEAARVVSFTNWGHTVTMIQDSSSQSAFDTAIESADVVYVPGTIQDWELLYKLRAASCGVVTEVPGLDTEFGYATADGYTVTEQHLYDAIETHPVSAGIGDGTIDIFSSDQPMSQNGNTTAPDFLRLGDRDFGQMSLGVIETGGALANTYNGNSIANGRRVRLPWANITWSNLDADGERIAEQSIDWAATGSTLGGSTGNLLLVTADASLTSEEAARQSTFEGWGFTVTTIEDSATQATFDTALAASDVVYVSSAADATSLDYKLRKAKIGVVHEGISSWDDNVGWTTSTGQQANTCTTMTVVDNTHPISAHFSTGTVTIFNSSSGSNGSQVAATVAGGAEVLANNRCINAGSPNLLVMEIGATLANTYDGNSTASGRRVRLPFGGFGVSSWSNVSADGLTMVRSALEWASSDGLLLHWKLDDASGTTAEDSSGNGNDGTLTGSQAWTTGKDGGAHTFDYTDGTDDYFQAPSTPELNDVNEGNYTLMAYVKPNSLPPGTGSNNTAQYGILIKEGYHVGLIYTSEGRFQFDHYLAGSIWSGTGTWDDTFAPGQWYHVAGVVSRADGTVKIFVDGQLKFTDTFTAGTAGADRGSAPWRVGIGGPGFSNWRWAADADIDDARIYARALTDEEIAQYATSGLIAHWKFDEGTGTTVADDTGNGHDASFDTGTPTWTSGVRGGALEFDGTNLAATDSDFDPPATGAVAFWYRFNGSVASSERLFGLGGNWEVRADSAGALYLDINMNALVAGDGKIDGAVKPGQWHHVVVNTNDVSDTYQIYFDGTLHSQGSLTVSEQTAGVLAFGDRTGANQRFDGALDDLRVYNYELTAAEIAEVYGLIGHWKLDETSGTVAADNSGMGHDGEAINGATLGVSAIYKHGVEFDGTDDGVRVDDGGGLMATDALTVALWARADSLTSGTQYVVGKGRSTGYQIQISNGGLLQFMCRGTSSSALSVSNAITESRWTHLVATYDGSMMRIYRDGSLLASQASTGSISSASDWFHMGRRSSGTLLAFEGAIDDVRVYNRVMTPVEIAEHFGLVGWWRMEETSGTTVTDSSGMGNHGTLNTSATWSSGAKEGSGSLELDGTNYVEIPGLIASDTTDGVTVAGWAKLAAADTQGAELISLGNAFGVRLDDPYGGYYGSQAFAYHGSNWDSAKSGNNYAESGWRHFTAVFDPSELEIKLYIDGVLRVTTPATGPPVMSGLGSNTILGRHADGETNRDFTGLMDDMRVYNRAISPAEVRTLYYGEYVPGLRIVKWVEVANP